MNQFVLDLLFVMLFLVHFVEKSFGMVGLFYTRILYFIFLTLGVIYSGCLLDLSFADYLLGIFWVFTVYFVIDGYKKNQQRKTPMFLKDAMIVSSVYYFVFFILLYVSGYFTTLI